MHWKMFSGTPGLYPLEDRQQQEITNIFKISKSIKLLVKKKNVSFILGKKLNGPFGQPNIYGTGGMSKM